MLLRQCEVAHRSPARASGSGHGWRRRPCDSRGAPANGSSIRRDGGEVVRGVDERPDEQIDSLPRSLRRSPCFPTEAVPTSRYTPIEAVVPIREETGLVGAAIASDVVRVRRNLSNTERMLRAVQARSRRRIAAVRLRWTFSTDHDCDESFFAVELAGSVSGFIVGLESFCYKRSDEPFTRFVSWRRTTSRFRC